MDLQKLTLTEAIKKLKAKEISHSELFADLTAVISEKNPQLNVYLAQNEMAEKEAEKLLDSPLAGVPLAVKDNFLTKGMTTTASSKVLENFNPPYESTVTQRLKDAGAIFIGKTNMDAWAHGSSTETSDFGVTKNPQNTAHSPGGSSGGSGAAVAADMCISAIGSETAGSIRLPASWCGVVGVKPTYGRTSRAGVVAMGSSLDCPGPMGKTVEDCALLLNIISGKDQYDATTGDFPVPDFTQNLKTGVKGLKIGICYLDHPHLRGTAVDTAVSAAGKLFEEHGATVDLIHMSEQLEDNKILTPDHAIGVYTVVQRSEVSSNLARYDGIRYGNNRSYFGDEAKRRIILGTFTLSKGYADRYFYKAEAVREVYKKNFDQLFSKYDLLISTPSPGYALKIGESADNPMFGELTDLLNEPSSITGLPGISVPCWHDDATNLDLGLNIMAAHWQEEKMLKAAYLFEQSTKWNRWAKK